MTREGMLAGGGSSGRELRSSVLPRGLEGPPGVSGQSHAKNHIWWKSGDKMRCASKIISDVTFVQFLLLFLVLHFWPLQHEVTYSSLQEDTSASLKIDLALHDRTISMQLTRRQFWNKKTSTNKKTLMIWKLSDYSWQSRNLIHDIGG